MVNVSKKYLEEDLKREIWERFAKELSVVKSGEQARQLCGRLFTPSENIMLEKRLAISHLIKRGLTYKEIGGLIDVSSSTISFVRNEFKRRPASGTRVLRQRIPSPRKQPKFKRRRFPVYKGRGRWDFLQSR